MTSTISIAQSPAESDALPIYYPHAIDDIQITTMNSEGKNPQLVMKGPGDHTYVRTNQTGIKLLELLDGSRTPDEIRVEFGRRHGQNLPLEKLSAFLDLCARNGLLRAGTWPGAEAVVVRRPRSKSVKFYRQLVKGEAVVNWVASKRRWWLNPLTIGLMAVLIGFGLAWLVLGPSIPNMASVFYQIDPQANNAWLAFLPVLIFIELCFHELAHNLACRVNGVASGGFGMGLLWGILPVFFTDTGGAYTIDNKYRRAMVSLAGPLVDLTALGLVSLALWQLPESSMGFKLAASYHGLLLAMILVNLNPFLIRMDGYWILTDLIEEPNLRQNTVRTVLGIVMQKLGRPLPSTVGSGMAQYSPRRRRMLLLYGTVAILWTVFFLASFLISVINGLLTLVAAF